MKDEQNPSGIYQNLLREFHKLLDDTGLNQKSENGRYRIEFKSFRDFVKSQISDQGHGDYSEYHIGHKGSTYYSRTRADRIDVFRRIEPAITYLDKDILKTVTQDLKSQTEAQKLEIIQLKKQVAEAEDRNKKFVEEAREYMNRTDKEVADRVEEIDRRVKKLVMLARTNSKN